MSEIPEKQEASHRRDTERRIDLAHIVLRLLCLWNNRLGTRTKRSAVRSIASQCVADVMLDGVCVNWSFNPNHADHLCPGVEASTYMYFRHMRVFALLRLFISKYHFCAHPKTFELGSHRWVLRHQTWTDTSHPVYAQQ